MRSLGRSYVWWPGMDAAIERRVQTCPQCQQNRQSPPEASLHPWEWPNRSWSQVHLDFAGPFMGRMFLLAVDARSKWLEACPLTTTTSLAAIEKMRQMFANHGLPETIVTDNGPSFTSSEFREYMKEKGVVLVNTAPYHPASNGLAERAVQTFKEGMKKMQSEGGSLEASLAWFLLATEPPLRPRQGCLRLS